MGPTCSTTGFPFHSSTAHAGVRLGAWLQAAHLGHSDGAPQPARVDAKHLLALHSRRSRVSSRRDEDAAARYGTVDSDGPGTPVTGRKAVKSVNQSRRWAHMAGRRAHLGDALFPVRLPLLQRPQIRHGSLRLRHPTCEKRRATGSDLCFWRSPQIKAWAPLSGLLVSAAC